MRWIYYLELCWRYVGGSDENHVGNLLKVGDCAGDYLKKTC